MQLYVVFLVLVVLLLKCRERAMTVLYLLFAGVTALTGYLASKNKYIPTIFYMTPEVFRQAFNQERSFTEFFMAPSSAMLGLGGVIVAFLYVNHQVKGIKIANSKSLVVLHYFGIPALFAWSYICVIIHQKVSDHTTMTLLIPVERLVVCLLSGFVFYSMITLKTPLEAVFSQKFLRIFMRLSFAVSMVHWCVSMTLVASRQTLHVSSMLGLILDFIRTWAISYLIALPLTLMVEYPLQTVLERLI